MARLVLDTNSLIQCIARRSRYHAIWLSLLDGRNQLCVSNEILEEYEEILEYHFNLITADPDDNKFVDCAVTGNARFIVTEDRHYDVLRHTDFPKVNIIGLDEMLRKV